MTGVATLSYLMAVMRSADQELGPALDRARQLFERYHRFESDEVVNGTCRRLVPKVLVDLGRLRGVIYSSDRGQRGRDRTFVHFFETPPTLAADCRGKQIFVVGGNYRITRRGIEG